MEENLLARLEEIRAQLAERYGVPPYKILPNATLEEMARRCPVNKEELLRIKGWGAKRVALYGQIFLDAIRMSSSIAATPPTQEEQVFSVAEFLALLNRLLLDIGTVRVQGEIVQASVHPMYGYGFISIKDTTTKDHTLDCYLPRQYAALYSHLLDQGTEVIVAGVPSIYKTGKFRLTVTRVEPFGEGAIKKAFEALKKKLQAKGYFDPAHKQLPHPLIRTIGLLTSEGGEAKKDFLTNLGNFGFRIYFYPIAVQGERAEQTIKEGIAALNRLSPPLDIIVLTRGGGSLEDLKVFNSEQVADAIYLSRIPVLTGIGHEGNQSIADLVADVAVSTPSMAARYITERRQFLLDTLNKLEKDLPGAAGQLFSSADDSLRHVTDLLCHSYAKHLAYSRLRLTGTAGKLQLGLERIFTSFRTLHANFLQAGNSLAVLLERTRGNLASAEQLLHSLNPAHVLRRGYSIVYTAHRSLLRSADEVHQGEPLTIYPSQGKVTAIVQAHQCNEKKNILPKHSQSSKKL